MKFAIMNGLVVENLVIAEEEKGLRFILPEADIKPISEADEPFVGVGTVFDEVANRFKPSAPFESWIFDEDGWRWTAPQPYPADSGAPHAWDEGLLSWVQVQIPESEITNG